MSIWLEVSLEIIVQERTGAKIGSLLQWKRAWNDSEILDSNSSCEVKSCMTPAKFLNSSRAQFF